MVPRGAQVLSHFLLSYCERVAFVLVVDHGRKMATAPPGPVHIPGRKNREGVSRMPTMCVCFQKHLPPEPLLGKFGLILIDDTRMTWPLRAVKESKRVNAFSWPVAVLNKIKSGFREQAERESWYGAGTEQRLFYQELEGLLIQRHRDIVKDVFCFFFFFFDSPITSVWASILRLHASPQAGEGGPFPEHVDRCPL